MRVLGADELRMGVPMVVAIDALEAAFAAGDPDTAAPVRSSLETSAGSLLLMPASGDRGTGVKLVTLTESNPGRGLPFVNAAYVLFDPLTQVPEAVLDGGSLTALRTAAVSGLATRWLARHDAHSLVLFGAGVQAAAHLEAMVAVRPIREVVVVSRSQPRAEALVAKGEALGLQASLGEPSAVAGADLVCTCTTATAPVLDGSLLRAGTHVNAVGAYLPTTREIDTTAARSSRRGPSPMPRPGICSSPSRRGRSGRNTSWPISPRRCAARRCAGLTTT
jgi:ornithine cyclodeaminase/alanine dehydrogenase-like protein (mu-crystallin family)